ncbi:MULTISPECIES: methionine/alanine import family NSS transporter small subunit [Nocardioides]|uniref:Methionine/alanine import family NSS transporter small subunit n=1 Tax=Nocardioides vastitatis TaxID=2568655 RepID=A0ABW0ZL87_9ACTN|nr:methionine/alanine import family NSS transporter small subunit [Nocardioides sp.]THI98582.1 methionine/alanine import family NSS transporter small subunit [Nocardioides sp.]
MSADAVILMLVAMAILWGGLVLAIVRLNRHDLPPIDELHRDL